VLVWPKKTFQWIKKSSKKTRTIEGESELGRSPEETDQLSRSTKKMKRMAAKANPEAEGSEDEEMNDVELHSPRVQESPVHTKTHHAGLA